MRPPRLQVEIVGEIVYVQQETVPARVWFETTAREIEVAVAGLSRQFRREGTSPVKQEGGRGSMQTVPRLLRGLRCPHSSPHLATSLLSHLIQPAQWTVLFPLSQQLEYASSPASSSVSQSLPAQGEVLSGEEL